MSEQNKELPAAASNRWHCTRNVLCIACHSFLAGLFLIPEIDHPSPLRLYALTANLIPVAFRLILILQGSPDGETPQAKDNT